ncbi:histidine phosphatase family protein [Pseudomonas sp. B21-056]|jgi:probable phosphoglycerate mutase|uniref:histidine phosphatase family protein n=1 Tax=Pseudomonas sp. B21-056 TaxID=2895495 RepID=UPI0022318593|nr:histidine phosphatase family protein [Pseudomonas sp. B21-056]UZE22062.1 histidine phosphatase family protein [Pseudomonas sp. B21-056]
MHLCVIRHGETCANAEQRYLGSLDPALNERGRAQALALLGHLPENLDAIVVSPRLRTQETADIINRSLNLSSEIMDAFRGRDVGVFEGLTPEDASERYPELWSQNITRRWAAGPTGGESVSDVVTRVRRGLLELGDRYRSKTILLVTHGFIAKTIFALARTDFSDFYDWQLPCGDMLMLENVDVEERDAFGQKRPEGWSCSDLVLDR